MYDDYDDKVFVSAFKILMYLVHKCFYKVLFKQIIHRAECLLFSGHLLTVE